jgi:CHAT domain-containing protein
MVRLPDMPSNFRQLLSDLSEVYSGYFASLNNQGRTADAFRVIERARGRVETQALTHHEVIAPHEPNPTERHLTELNLALLNTDESAARGHILDAIYQTEQQLDSGSTAVATAPAPVDLGQLQSDLRPSELFIEYVIDSPQSYALEVTHETVHRYTLPSKDVLEQEVTQYRSEILQQRTDLALGQQLFNSLLGEIQELKEKQSLIVVPDGKLHRLPFSTLASGGHHVLASDVVTVAPSGTVLHILRHRANETTSDDLPYVGEAAWTTNSSSPATLPASSFRVSGRRGFCPSFNMDQSA